MDTKFVINCLVLWSTLFYFTSAQVPGLRFLLYTKANKALGQEKELKADDPSTIFNSNFVRNKPVKFLTHGYTSSYTLEFPQDMKNTYLSLVGDYNVIAVDWAELAKSPYQTAAGNVPVVGLQIAKLITALINNGNSSLPDFHHIGHSLGAQVGAFISSNLPLGSKMKRVTGLDPGRPGFENSVPAANRLDPTDADFVDIITTSCGIGCTDTTPDPPRGTVDFYPNGGLKQPGCALIDPLTGGLCSHCRSYKFYEESITTTTKGFKSFKCNSYANYLSGCPKTQSAFMGEYVSPAVSGTYYLKTNTFPPYAQG